MVRVHPVDNNSIQLAFQAFRRNLGQDGVAPGSHVGGADHQGIIGVILEPYFHGRHINIGDTGSLHGDGSPHRPDLCVADPDTGKLFLPPDHLPALLNAGFQGTRIEHLPMVGREGFPLFQQIFQPQFQGVHLQFGRQFVHGRFQGKSPLGGPVPPEGTSGHGVGVDHLVAKFKGIGLVVQGQGFVTGKPHGGGAVFPVGPGIGQGMQMDGQNFPLVVRPHLCPDDHLMAAGGADEGFGPAKNNFGGSAGLQGHKGRKQLADKGLLGSEPGSDPGLDHPDLLFGNIKGPGRNPPDVEGNLSGGDNGQPIVVIQIGIGPEGFHHGLAVGLDMVDLVHDHVSGRKLAFCVPAFKPARAAKIARHLVADVKVHMVVRFGMDDTGVIQGLFRVQNRLQHLIAYLDLFDGPFHLFFHRARHNGHGIPHIPDKYIQDQPVIGAWFGIGLAGHGKPVARHIPVGEHTGDSRQPLGPTGIHINNFCKGVGAPEKFDNQAVFRGKIIGVHRLARDQGQGVHFRNGLVYNSHDPPLLALRYRRMARIWPA